jgi:uncharacterized protein (TIGR02996 family)
MSDDAFIRAILAAPSNETRRLIYADWLEERGDPRGAFLRAQVAMTHLAPGDPRRAELHALLRGAGAAIDPDWVAAVSCVPIESCGVKFRLRCPKRWQDLEPTSDEAVRFCGACRQQVFFCHSIEVAQTHAAVGECIAVDPRLVRRAGDLESNIWELDVAVGLPMPDELSPRSKEEEPSRRIGRRRER